MDKYVVDTNLFVRLLVKDNLPMQKQVQSWFEQAQAGEIKLIVYPQVFFEIEYISRRVYSKTKTEICDYLLSIINSYYLEVEQRETLKNAVISFQENTLSLVDSWLIHKAQASKAKVLTFDKKLQGASKKI